MSRSIQFPLSGKGSLPISNEARVSQELDRLQAGHKADLFYDALDIRMLLKKAEGAISNIPKKHRDGITVDLFSRVNDHTQWVSNITKVTLCWKGGWRVASMSRGPLTDVKDEFRVVLGARQLLIAFQEFLEKNNLKLRKDAGNQVAKVLEAPLEEMPAFFSAGGQGCLVSEVAMMRLANGWDTEEKVA